MVIKIVPIFNWTFWRKFLFLQKVTVYESFSELERRIVVLWQWISNRLSKISFISLKAIFKDIVSFLKKTSTIWSFVSKFERKFFRTLGKKCNFVGKKSARLSQVDSTLPEGLFEESFFSGKKNQIKKRFRELSGSSLCFVEPSRQVRGKCITASRWTCWGETYMFFGRLIRRLQLKTKRKLHVFFSRWVEILRQKNSTELSNLRFYLSIESFSWGKFSFEKINILVFLIRFFLNFVEKIRTFDKKVLAWL